MYEQDNLSDFEKSINPEGGGDSGEGEDIR